MTKLVNTGGYDPSGSFQLVHCGSVEEISIGDYSFSDYGSFEIRNCSNLVSIQFGQMVFCYAVDVIMESEYLIIWLSIDLNKMSSIFLGEYSLHGLYTHATVSMNDTSVLTLQSLSGYSDQV